MQAKQQRLSGWGRVHQGSSAVYRPEQIAHSRLCLTAPGEQGILPLGAGCSYGDQALNSGGEVILTERLNRILAFDPQSGEVVLEAGVTFADLLSVTLPAGWIPPVIPGTLQATLGGACANDVHGKNHFHYGSFGQHINWLELQLPEQSNVHLSRREHADLFRATIGGMGLTGLMTTMSLQCIPGKPWVQVKQRRVSELAEWFEVLPELASNHAYCVGWLANKNTVLGRGVLSTADPIPGPIVRPSPWQVPHACQFPLIRPSTMGFLKKYLYTRTGELGRQFRQPLTDFINPLDKINNWPALYGCRGFVQFHSVLPFESAHQGYRELLQYIRCEHLPLTLGVIKLLNADAQGLLGFCQPGVTLALDFPYSSKIVEHFKFFIDSTIAHQGRVYCAKDSFLTPEQYKTMYPALPDFQHILARYRLTDYYQSDLSRRLKIGASI